MAQLGDLAKSFASLSSSSLNLPNGVIDFGCIVPFLPGSGTQKLFVRPCYLDLDGLIRESLRRKTHFVVCGTPGVGKSFFGLYMLAKLINDGGLTVYYQCEEGSYIFSAVNDPTEVHEPHVFHRTLKKSPAGTSWYIVDGIKPHFVNHIPTVLITSPRKAIWHTFQKQCRATMYYVPLWTLDELQLCRSLMYSDLVSEEEVNIRFGKWGGSSRYVFCSALDNCQNELYFETAIAKSDEEFFTRAIGNPDADSHVRHILMHYIVTVDGDYKYIWYHLAAASSYVFNRLANSLVDRNHQRVVTFLMGGSYTSKDPTSTFRGHLFEGVAHKYLCNGGKFSVRSLESNNTEEIDIEPAQSIDQFSSLPLQFQPGVYYQPISSCYPAIDAFRCSSNEAILFQMTIATRHPIVHNELQTLIGKLKVGGHVVRRLYFVVSEKEFGSFEMQKYKSKQRTVMEHIDMQYGKSG